MASPSPQSPSSSQRLPPWLQGLLAGLTLWGLYLAIGATGLFSRGRIVTDPRRSLIVLACSALFLGSWYYILRRRRKQETRETTDQETAANGPTWNQASLVSTAVAVMGYLLWGTAWLMWAEPSSQHQTAPLGYLSALAFGVAAVMAMIGLSDPRRRRGQLAGALTLILLLAAAVAFVLQVQRFSARRAAGRDLPSTSSLAIAQRLAIPHPSE